MFALIVLIVFSVFGYFKYLQIDEDELDYFFEFSKDSFKLMKKEYQKYL